MLDPRIPFKNRWLACGLAFLIPGAGHLYQGRYFKGIVCCICILGTFLIGMGLGDWGIVYWKRDPANFLNPYYAQFFVGLPALPSLIQARRAQGRGNSETSGLDAPLKAPFHGTLRSNEMSPANPEGKLIGTVTAQPEPNAEEGRVMRGTFNGTLAQADGTQQDVSLKLGGVPIFGKPVSADPDLRFEADVVDAAGGGPRPIGRLRGSIPRSFINRFEVPPDDVYNGELHRQLGKFHELAMTFTMIAGLLNILVILDALEGPAYGYGIIAGQNAPPPSSGAGAVRPPEPPT